jgi:hypothetical protein
VDTDGDGLTDRTEIVDLIGWTLPIKADSDGDGVLDGAEDIDGDGLTNIDEQRLRTNATNADSDSDGVSDGAEVSRGTDPLKADPRTGPPVHGDTPPILPAPDETDTDGDGLSDVAEGEEETDPANVDSDGDGLSDGQEVNELQISAINADTDGDGLGDGYEVTHAENEGLDPGRPDERVSKWSYVSDFLLGLVAGDFSIRDSMAWLSGSLCSGGLSIVPVVGWILGGLADIRDTIAGLIHGDWVSAGLSILGVVPYVGDAVAIPGKAAKFAFKYRHRIDAVLRFVAKYDKIPDPVKELSLQLILEADWDYLVGESGQPVQAMASRFSKAGLLRLAKGDRTDIKRIARAMYDPNHVPGPRVPFMYNWRAAEDYLADTLLKGRPGTRGFVIPTPGYPNPRSKHRKVDFAEQTPDGIVAHEVKAGVPNRKDDVDQCKKDAWIMDPANAPTHGKGKIKAIHWHFFPHGRFNSLGPSQDLLNCLTEKGIPFTIHAPDV